VGFVSEEKFYRLKNAPVKFKLFILQVPSQDIWREKNKVKLNGITEAKHKDTCINEIKRLSVAKKLF